MPPRVEYSLTPKGEALVPLIEDMRRYGREYLGVDDCAVTPAPGASRSPPSSAGRSRQDTPVAAPKSRRMRNRALHDALRDFALEAAALLTEELKAGAEVEFDVVDEGGGRGPALYRYEPRTGAFIEERWPQLRELPTAERACHELGAGASAWLRVNGLRGEQAEPALRAMLERLYEDATSFGFPEERFERVYGEVELTLYRDAVRARVIAPVHAAWMDAERVELGDGLSLVRGDALEGPHDRASLLCVLERDVPADDPIPRTRPRRASPRSSRPCGCGRRAVSSWGAGLAPGRPRRWQPVRIGSAAIGAAPSACSGPATSRRSASSTAAIAPPSPPASVAWALARFEMGCAQATQAEALSDYLLGLRGAAGRHDRDRPRELRPPAGRALRRGGRAPRATGARGGRARTGALRHGRLRRVRVDAESPRELIAEIEGHLRALLRDVLCGYLDADLKGGSRRHPARVAGRAAR